MTEDFRVHGNAAVRTGPRRRTPAPVTVVKAHPAAMELARRTPDTWVRVDRDGAVYVLNRAVRSHASP